MRPVSNEAAERAAEREAMKVWCREEMEYREREAWDSWDPITWEWEAHKERERQREELEQWYYGGDR